MGAPGDRLLRANVRASGGRLLSITLASVAATAAALLIPGALAVAVDNALAGRLGAAQLIWLVALAAVEIGADAVGGLLSTAATASGTARLRHRLLRAQLALGHPHPLPAGEAISRLTGDCAGAGVLGPVLVQLLTAAMVSCGALFAMARLDWQLAVVFLAGLPVALLLARGHLRRTADDVATYQKVSGELSARLLDAVRGLRTIAASGTA